MSNEKEQPLVETFTLASCAWALGETLTSGHQTTEWLDGFNLATIDFAHQFAARMAQLARAQAKESDAIAANNREIFQTEDVALDVLPTGKSDKTDIVVHLPILSYHDLVSETRIVCEKLGVTNLFDKIEIRIKSQKEV